MQPTVRNVNAGRGYTLNQDNYQGLKEAANTNRPILALEYVSKIVTDLEARIKVLEAELAAVDTKKSAPRKTAKQEEAKDEAAEL